MDTRSHGPRRRGAVLRPWLGALVLAAATLGCESESGNPAPSAAPPTESPRQHPVLEHVPLPPGFALVPERSVARLVGPIRVAQCEFVGPTPVDDVVDFYVRWMPEAKFTLRQKRLESGQYVLWFESRSEECIVRVRPKGSKRTTLTLDLGPLPDQAAGQPPRRPAAEAEAPTP